MISNSSSQSRFKEVWQIAERMFRILSGRQMAGRGLTVFPDDVYLVSYPRSGNTWTRFLLGNLLNPHQPVTFADIEGRIPEIYFSPDRMLRRLPRPRVLKSHECFQPLYKRVIYIVRDPRDVAVSFYHHHVKARNLSDNYPMDKYVPRFVAGEFDPAFGSWGDNVQSWLSMRGGTPDFLLLQYEQMLAAPENALKQVSEFLVAHYFQQIDSTPQRIHRAVELSSSERMRTLEKQQSKKWILTRGTRQDKPFVRLAKTGEWKNVLLPAEVHCIEAAWGELMQRLGYALSNVEPPAQIQGINNQEVTVSGPRQS